MEKILPVAISFLMATAVSANGARVFETDSVGTSSGDLTITFIGHASLIFGFEGRIIHVDPFSKLADYSLLPDADVVLITHDHFDHLDLAALGKIRKSGTIVIADKGSAAVIDGALVMGNGDRRTVGPVNVEAVPAYNVVHMRSKGVPFHPKGAGNGYVITFGDKRVYVAGDTENIPEMRDLKDIDIAFLPMNLPYTMTPEMAADAALMFHPAVLYPYHFGETDPSRLVELLKGTGIEVRVRSMK